MNSLFVFVFVLVVVVFVAGTKTEDHYKESVRIQPLPGSKIGVFFKFETKGDVFSSDHTILSPSLLSLVKKHWIKDLDVSLTHGRWLTDNWGSAPFNTEAPNGAVMSASFRYPGSTVSEQQEQWTSLRSSLAELLCAALNDAGAGSNDANSAFLPQEVVCTENFLPWISLLPCRNRAGVAALLSDPKSLYGKPYHSMRLSISLDTSGDITSTQTLAVVFPVDSSKPEINISALFSSQSTIPHLTKCPEASSSSVHIDLYPKTDKSSVVSPKIPEEGFFNLRRKNLLSSQPIVLSSSAVLDADKPLFPSPITTHTFLSGYGQRSCGIITEVGSRTNEELIVHISQDIPCYVHPFLSSFRAFLNETRRYDIENITTRTRQVNDRCIDTILSFNVKLPPYSKLRTELRFEDALLHISSQPFEAERGRDLPPPVVTCYNNKGEFITKQYAESLLVTTPWPDFSMPYNVLTLSCTVVSVFFSWIMRLIPFPWDASYNKKTKTFIKQKKLLPTLLDMLITRPLEWVKNKLTKKKSQNDTDE